MEEFDVVVVGAGVIGSATAYQLLKHGASRVLLLEQFSLLHTRGSSHGGSRITRRAYVQSHFVHMMDEAFKLWSNLEQESGVKLYTPTGILLFGEKSNESLQSAISSLESNNVPHEKFSGEEGNRRYPDQLSLPSSYMCVLERDGGILSPPKVLSAFQDQFVKAGGVIRDNCPVTDVTAGPDGVKIDTSNGSLMAKKVVLTVGPWTRVWMKKLDIINRIELNRFEAFYWKVEQPESYQPSKFPVFLYYASDIKYFYGLPIFEQPGMVKICQAGGPVIDHPDNRDDNPTTEYNERTSRFIKEHFKGVATASSVYEPCITSWTCDENPILDYHPKHSNIIIGVGLSGHGFKLSPVIGKVLSELALDLKPSYDISFFKIM